MKDEARRMSTLVGNLLDMARIESGDVKLNLEWQPFEEVVGSALSAARSMLKQHTIEVHLPRDLPLVRFDALLDRARARQSARERLEVHAGGQVTCRPRWSAIPQRDGRRQRPRLPPGREEAVFQKFTRGERESATPGVGLGLAICRAIIESHQARSGAQSARRRRELHLHAALRNTTGGRGRTGASHG
jgi:two-component system, OmpR family, sensor histidine kinase KdpD